MVVVNNAEGQVQSTFQKIQLKRKHP